jgi:hypothetical protein
MCELCRQTPCAPRCPNAPEPDPVCWCDQCGRAIYDGETYYDTGSEYLCEECIDKWRRDARKNEFED